MGYWMASSGDDSDSSSDYFSPMQSPSVSATPQSPAAPATPADEYFSQMHSPSVSEYVSLMQSPSVSATPQSPAAPATPAMAADEYFSPMQSPSVPATPQIPATPQSPAAPATPAAAAAAIGAEIPASATAVEATIETEMPLFTLLITVLGVILTVFVTSGHPRRGVRYSAYAVTGLLSLTLVLLAMGGWFGRSELIRAGRYLAWVVVIGAAIVFALFVFSVS